MGMSESINRLPGGAVMRSSPENGGRLDDVDTADDKA
jgi:hypothetical protein